MLKRILITKPLKACAMVSVLYYTSHICLLINDGIFFYYLYGLLLHSIYSKVIGFFLLRMVLACANGTYGVDCKENCTCNTNHSSSCDIVTGSCSCQSGFQLPNCDTGRYLMQYPYIIILYSAKKGRVKSRSEQSISISSKS